MMNEKVRELLNQQINKELYSAYLYLDFSNYFEERGLSGFANWYYIQAQEERDHAMLFYRYLLNNNEKVTLEAIAKPDKVLDMIASRVSACAALTEEVEFSAADAVRSEPAFLVKACEAALSAGAKYITLCDSEGVATPTEIASFLKNFREASEALGSVALGVRCNDSLSMASANKPLP